MGFLKLIVQVFFVCFELACGWGNVGAPKGGAPKGGASKGGAPKGGAPKGGGTSGARGAHGQRQGDGQACRRPKVGGEGKLGGRLLASVEAIRPPAVGQSVQRQG